MNGFSGHSQSLEFIESQYAAYLADPGSVTADWRAYFDGLPTQGSVDRTPFAPRSLFRPASVNGAAPAADSVAIAQQERLDQLVRCFRARGHVIAKLDPLGSTRLAPPELDPAFYGFEEDDFDRRFSTNWMGESESHTLREILEHLRNTYCGYIGVQFMHIDSLVVRTWLQTRMEKPYRPELSRKEQLRLLSCLSDAVIFEEFIQSKYVGAKSFSLEGAESLIPLLDLAIEKAGRDGVQEIVLGMAHRGRLNVLANILGKHPRDIFREFDDSDPDRHIGRGDVKYHLGYSSDREVESGGSVHLTLCFNPSHLEFVNPVALGRLRAKQARQGDAEGERSLGILIHGDAAFAGQGVVQETLNLSELPGYSTGGTIHVIANNQIGFTTPPEQSRSCLYATDVAKMLQIPIFHVNGEHPEAVAQVVHLALDFRKRFHRDVVIDMYCYRRRGHNESDEPSFTQPLMYRAINKRPNVREGYLQHLLALGQVTQNDADRIEEEQREQLTHELEYARSADYEHQPSFLHGVWEGYIGGQTPDDAPPTGVNPARLSALLHSLGQLPEDFHPHPKIKRLLAARGEMADGKRPLDWGAAETLAFATLVEQGFRLRLSGQDCGRGTFSHRHAALIDHQSGHSYVPLQHLSETQAAVEILNSPLSETGVLGFDYGFSLDSPDALVIWEAQFGDFCNGAQVIIDQFIATAEDKWNRLSGLVLMLPHGWEGQGPEHSSARLERFLSLAAEQNMQIVNLTTPAQLFHLLRLQMLRRWRKPLVMMTPKSLLRHREAVSELDACASGQFQRILTTPAERSARRVLFCSGKIYYELLHMRETLGLKDVAIVRLEQLYPFPERELKSLLADWGDETQLVWVQEEPENMGAWWFFRTHYERCLGDQPLVGVCRPESASPATGSKSSHHLEQMAVVEAAFAEHFTASSNKHWPWVEFGREVPSVKRKNDDARS